MFSFFYFELVFQQINLLLNSSYAHNEHKNYARSYVLNQDYIFNSLTSVIVLMWFI